MPDSNLSPAAQKVKDAVLATYSPDLPPNSIWALEQRGVAAALRAAADQVCLRWAELQHPADVLNAIADELEGMRD